jgi:hypothetical protein
MARSEVSAMTAIVRVHRFMPGLPACRNWACLRRHVWSAACDCGWRRLYRKRWEAQRGLRIFHWKDNHGGACG